MTVCVIRNSLLDESITNPTQGPKSSVELEVPTIIGFPDFKIRFTSFQ